MLKLPILAYNWIKNTESPSITIDEFGYYFGYIIGVIIELAAEILTTGGASTVAEAFTKLGQQMVEVFNGAKKLGKTAVRTLEISFEKILALFKYISEKSKNLKTFFEDFWKWINELFEKGKQHADSIKNFLIRQYKISKATLELLEDLGVTIIRNIDDKLRYNPALITPEGFRVLYENKTLFEGTGNDIKRFVDKIEDINKNSGSKGCKKYLDDLSENLNIKYKDFLESNGLRIEKPKGGRNNLQIIDKNNEIHFYGKPEEVDEYIRLISRTDAEKIADYKKVLNYFNSSKAKYGKEKLWKDGTLLKFSEHTKPPISVDFSHTPQFLYGQKNGKPGIVKIKLTGNDIMDFKMAYKKAGISDELAVVLEEKHTWHHLDDFNPLTGECTMQLVNTLVHKSSCPHIGGGGLYKAFMGVGYPNREINFVLK